MTSDDHPRIAYDVFERHVVAGRISRNDEDLHEVLEGLRPDLVIFDNRGRTAQVRFAASLGARVIYIATQKHFLRRTLRPQRLWNIHELWVVQRRFRPGPSRLPVLQRACVALSPGLRFRNFDAILPEPCEQRAAELRAKLKLDGMPYVVFAAGGGGYHHEGRPVAEVFGEAAMRAARDRGVRSVLVMGPLYHGQGYAAPGVTTIESLSPPEMIDLLNGAELVACGGGGIAAQTLTLGRPCVVTPVGGPDQPERVARCGSAGLLEPSPLHAVSLTNRVVALHDDVDRRLAIAERIRSCGFTNGLPAAVQRFEVLLQERGFRPS